MIVNTQPQTVAELANEIQQLRRKFRLFIVAVTVLLATPWLLGAVGDKPRLAERVMKSLTVEALQIVDKNGNPAISMLANENGGGAVVIYDQSGGIAGTVLATDSGASIQLYRDNAGIVELDSSRGAASLRLKNKGGTTLSELAITADTGTPVFRLTDSKGYIRSQFFVTDAQGGAQLHQNGDGEAIFYLSSGKYGGSVDLGRADGSRGIRLQSDEAGSTIRFYDVKGQLRQSIPGS